MTLTRALHDPAAGPRLSWAVVSDAVMGGVSSGTMSAETIDNRPALRLRGQVRLDNNGGFLQLAADLAPQGGVLDTRGWDGVQLLLRGDGAEYGVHLRSTDLSRPWQSYRAQVTAPATWQMHRLAFAQFAPHRTDTPLDPARLRRIGIVAIGRERVADIALGGLWLWRAAPDRPDKA